MKRTSTKPPRQQHLETYARPPWTPAEDAQLGTAPDSTLAARLGRSRGSIAARRHYLGIPSPRPAGRPWPDKKSLTKTTP
jgi:hypothetical protein